MIQAQESRRANRYTTRRVYFYHIDINPKIKCTMLDTDRAEFTTVEQTQRKVQGGPQR